MNILLIVTLVLLITLSNCQRKQGQNRGNQKQSHQPQGQKHGHQKHEHPHGGSGKSRRHGQSNQYIDWVKKNKKSSWKEGRNFHNDTSIEYLEKLGGSVRRRPHGHGRKGFSVQPDKKPETFELPAVFDARYTWPNCRSISEVSDQGSCGSCWAIAPSHVMTDRTCILSRGRVQFRFSTEDLMTCCTNCGDGCDGGDPYVAFEYWINNGIVSGGYQIPDSGCLQYSIPPCEHRFINSSLPLCDAENITTPECKRACDSSYSIPYADDLFKGEKAYNISTVDDAMFDLVTKGPISATMLVYQDFFSYKSGIYQETPGAVLLGRHAIRIIGYGEEGGMPYWLCANSWNTNWGDEGFFKIKRGINECGIEDELIAGIPKL